MNESMVRALSLTALLVGCSNATIVTLPPLDGFATMLIGPPRGPLEAIALPVDELRVDLPTDPSASVHAVILLYDEPLSVLDLPLDAGRVALTDDPETDTVPTPDRALDLDSSRGWIEADSAPWSSRRMVHRPCLTEIDVARVGIDDDRGLIGLLPWSDHELLLGTSDALYLVTRQSARRVATSLPDVGIGDSASMDDVGHVWLVGSTTVSDGAAIAPSSPSTRWIEAWSEYARSP